MTVQERRAKIKSYIVSLGGKPVGKKAICEAVKYPASGDFAMDMKIIMEQSDSIIASGTGKLRVYSFNPTKALYSEVKNPEGYKDSTAGKAIANVMRSSSMSKGTYPMRQQFGDVWQFGHPNGSQEGMLVISAMNGSVICVPVYPTRQGYMDDNATISWMDEDNKLHYVHLMNIQSRAERDLKRKLFTIPKVAQDKISKGVSDILGIKPDVVEKVVTKEIPVEKIVEKVVTKEVPVEKIVEKEVPVEVIKEVPTSDPRDIELATLRVRVEVYEQFLRGEFKGLAS